MPESSQKPHSSMSIHWATLATPSSSPSPHPPPLQKKRSSSHLKTTKTSSGSPHSAATTNTSPHCSSTTHQRSKISSTPLTRNLETFFSRKLSAPDFPSPSSIANISAVNRT